MSINKEIKKIIKLSQNLTERVIKGKGDLEEVSETLKFLGKNYLIDYKEGKKQFCNFYDAIYKNLRNKAINSGIMNTYLSQKYPETLDVKKQLKLLLPLWEPLDVLDENEKIGEIKLETHPINNPKAKSSYVITFEDKNYHTPKFKLEGNGIDYGNFERRQPQFKKYKEFIQGIKRFNNKYDGAFFLIEPSTNNILINTISEVQA